MKRANLGSSRRMSLMLLGGVMASFGALTGAVFLEGCSDTNSSTGGRRVVLETRVDLDPGAKAPFVTGFGWQVTLTRAVLATGPFYYFDGAPPLVFAPVEHRSPWDFARRLLGLRLAHAHPGHYQSGNALGQMLEAFSVDLFAGGAELPAGDGISGVYRSARFSFSSPPKGPLADALGAHVALVAGRAEKAGEETRVFRASADLADVAKSAADGRVEGCEFTEVDVESDGTVTVSVRPQVWFDLVDFAQIPAGTDALPSDFPADSQPKVAFSQGLAQLSAYKFSYSAP